MVRVSGMMDAALGMIGTVMLQEVAMAVKAAEDIGIQAPVEVIRMGMSFPSA